MMKKIQFLLILSLITLISFSCSDKEPEQNINRPGAFVATIDGETIDFYFEPYAVSSACNDIPCLRFEGRSGAEGNEEISIGIVNVTGAGTYVIDGISYSYGYYATSSPETGIVTSYGTSSATEEGFFTITSYEGNNIKGNFSFSAVGYDNNEVISISGTFDLEVIE